MILCYKCNDGAAIINSDVSAYRDLLIQALTDAGVEVYLGNPTENGCPFDFGDFSYSDSINPSYDAFMITFVYPGVTTCCGVIAVNGTLTVNSFQGGSSTKAFALFFRDQQNQLIFKSADSGISKQYFWILKSTQKIGFISDNFHPLVVGSIANAVYIYYSFPQSKFYTNYGTEIPVPTLISQDPHTLIINKPQAEYGIAIIRFPTGDPPPVYNYLPTLLINGVSYTNIMLKYSNGAICIY